MIIKCHILVCQLQQSHTTIEQFAAVNIPLSPRRSESSTLRLDSTVVVALSQTLTLTTSSSCTILSVLIQVHRGGHQACRTGLPKTLQTLLHYFALLCMHGKLLAPSSRGHCGNSHSSLKDNLYTNSQFKGGKGFDKETKNSTVIRKSNYERATA